MRPHLELRQDGENGPQILAGSFPYGQQATVKDRGKVRKEIIGPNAFSWQLMEFAKLQRQMGETISKAVNDHFAQARIQMLQEQLERRNVNILAGHSFDAPLGDMKRGSARVTSTDESLDFEVDLPAEADRPVYMAGPGEERQDGPGRWCESRILHSTSFAVAKAESFAPEVGNPSVQIRTVHEAVMPEISIVTRPVFGSTSIELRAEEFDWLEYRTEDYEPDTAPKIYIPSVASLWL